MSSHDPQATGVRAQPAVNGSATDDVPPAASRKSPPWAKVAIGVAAAVGLYFAVGALGEQLPAAFAWIEGLGAWGPIGYIVLYAGATVFMVPGLVMTLAGGALFGLVAGTAWVFIGATIGSGAAFLVGRHLARSTIEHRIAGNARFDAIDRAVGADGLRMVLLLRLSPVFPFVFLNYALGLTRIHFRDYMLAAIGMLPGTVLYVYYGALIGDVARVAGGVQTERGALEWSLMVLGLAATFGVTWLVTRRARAALAEVDALKDVETAAEDATP